MIKFLQQVINGLSIGSIYALIAVGYSLVYSILSFANFSHGGFLVVGSYAGFIALGMLGLPFSVAIACAIVSAGLIAVVAERLAYRPVRLRGGDPLYFMIASLGVGIFIENAIIVTIGPQFRTFPDVISTRSIAIGGLNIATMDLVAAIVAAVGLVAMEYYINKTKAGVAIRAAAFDMRTAGLMGINVDGLIMKVFFIAGLMAGIGGVFMGMKYTVYPQLGAITTKAMIAAIFGGLGSISGAIYGSIILGLVECFVSGYISSTLRDLIVYAILIVLLLFRPTGLKGKSVEEKV